jgi:phage terminase large subunit
MEVNLNYGTIFKKTRLAENDGKKVIIHKGGTGSGKTFDLMLYLISLTFQNKNEVTTVVSESHPHLQIGAIRILKNLLQGNDIWHLGTFTQNPTVWLNASSGSLIEFFSADRIDKALGARRDRLFGNEINSLKLEVWDELARRSENVYGDFNPTSQFWLEDWIANYDDTVIIKSNYKDNPYLPETERKRIEKRASRDANFRRVHIDCEYGMYEGLIFSDIEFIDEMPELPLTYGLDFGYTNDPTAVVAVAQTGDAYYLDELIYQTGLRNADIASMMKQQGITNRDTIYADSAEPKSIDDIYLAGFNVLPAVKGKDSIEWGISLMKQRRICVTKRSVNLIKELRNYSYQKDKEGRTVNVPIDAWNHGIDAARYAIMMLQRQKIEYTPLHFTNNKRRL